MLLRKRTNNLFDDFFGEMFDDPFFTQSMTPQLMKTDVLEKDGQNYRVMKKKMCRQN